MNKMRILQSIWAVALAFAVLGCDSSEPEIPLGEFERGVLIMNEGAFGSNDGEVYHYVPESEEVQADVFETQNSRPFAGLLEDMVLDNDLLYLVANTGKVEIVDSRDFSSIGAVSSGLDISRSLVVGGGKLFISDYGPFDENFATPESYVAVVSNLQGGTVSKKISVARKPEGLFVVNNNVLVAVAQDRVMEIIDISTEEVVDSREIEGAPIDFFEANGQLYLYARDASSVYFHQINKNDLTISNTTTVELERSTNRFALGDNNDVYIITSTGWPDYNDAVSSVSLSTGEVKNEELFTGSGFYGIGYDQNRKQIYVADNNAFQGNGTVIILSESGQEVNRFDAGRAPSGFLFR